MIYITQLIYVNDGKQSIFEKFEDLAIPLLSKYGGVLLLRFKPDTVIESSIDIPYEVHIISFPSDEHFEAFKNDDERKAFLHLKEESVKESILICGKPV